MEEFLDHIQNCSSCYDELETYFIVHEGNAAAATRTAESPVLDFKRSSEAGYPEIQTIYPVRKSCTDSVSVASDMSSDRGTGSAFLVYVMMQTVHVL